MRVGVIEVQRRRKTPRASFLAGAFVGSDRVERWSETDTGGFDSIENLFELGQRHRERIVFHPSGAPWRELNLKLRTNSDDRERAVVSFDGESENRFVEFDASLQIVDFDDDVIDYRHTSTPLQSCIEIFEADSPRRDCRRPVPRLFRFSVRRTRFVR